MTEKEPTLEQVKRDLLEFAGWKHFPTQNRLVDRWKMPDGKWIYSPSPISLKWLEDWAWPKLEEPIIKTEPWLKRFRAKLYSNNAVTTAIGLTRSEAAARATWWAIQPLTKPPDGL